MSQMVFILEDDVDVAAVFRRALEDHGYAVERFSRRAELVRRLGKRVPDICLIDLGLPDGDGLSVVGHLLRDLNVPTIIVTGRGELADRVVGLEVGADDYLVKPVEPRELIARIRSVLRRSGPSENSVQDTQRHVASFEGWHADFNACMLTAPDNTSIELSVAEAAVLKELIRAAGRVLSRASLLNLDSPGDLEPYDRSIDVRISRLRRKLGDDPSSPKIIKTVYGAGYMFVPKVEWVKDND